MQIKFIRMGLVLSAVWLVYYNAKRFFLIFNIPTTEEISLFSSTMSLLSDFVLGLPLIVILVWALFNLKPFSWLSAQTFASFIKAFMLVACVALIANTSVNFVKSAPYLPNVHGSQFLKFLGMMDWLPFTLAELSLLGFAYIQLSSKTKGQNMSEKT